MQASVISREFTWNGVKIPDPGRHLSPEEVRAVLATMYPDIATATITGPEAVGEQISLSFRRRNRHQRIGADESRGVQESECEPTPWRAASNARRDRRT